ncbi:hypothetical protein Q5752_003637 [Cryptotrichosporon argae]
MSQRAQARQPAASASAPRPTSSSPGSSPKIAQAAPRPTVKPATGRPVPLPAALPRARVAVAPSPTSGRAAPVVPRASASVPVDARSKSLYDSFRSLPSKQRILVGVGFAVIATAGLFVDRFVAPLPEGEARPALITVVGGLHRKE